MKNNLQAEVIKDLKRRKKASREHLLSLSPDEKIARLFELQERYYQMLALRETNGGRPIPAKWQKWRNARHENANVE